MSAHSPNSIRTPAARVRGLGSAKSGTGHFWLQRVTAVANLPLTLAFLVIALMLSRQDHAGAVALIGNPIVALIVIGFMLSVAVHMRAGMQVIIEDYVHAEGPKLLLLMLNTFFSVLIGLAATYAVIRIGLGG